MAVTDTSHERITRFFGLSTDMKPTNAMVDSTFTETDTQKEFVYDGVNWTRSPTVVTEQLPALALNVSGIVDTIVAEEVVTSAELLAEILVQMKIQNAHLSVLIGEELDETDIPRGAI